MRIEIIKNFINSNEIKILNEWTELAVKNNWFDFGYENSYGVKSTKRLNTRLTGYRFSYPELALNLSNKIKNFVGINKYSLINNHGKDGIVVNYTMNGGDVFKHKDPKSEKMIPTLRCNILTQKSEIGGELFVDNKLINVNVGDLHCYLVSEHEHWVTQVEGNTPRIMWMFGAHVPAEDWNSGKIKVQQ